MGTVTINHADCLYWLGRYTERVYSTIRFFSNSFDRVVGHDAEACADFCKKLDIPNIYQDASDFLHSYNFDHANGNSIAANLDRAYDNAVVMRDELGSDALCYIQMAVDALERAAVSETPYLEMLKLTDSILAFWGLCDDMIADENVRNIIKVGKRIERIDIYARLEMPREDLCREIGRLNGRIRKTSLHFDEAVLESLLPMAEMEEIPYRELLRSVDSVMTGHA